MSLTSTSACNCKICVDSRARKKAAYVRANGIRPRQMIAAPDFGPVEKRILAWDMPRAVPYRPEGATAAYAPSVPKRPAVDQYTIKAFHANPKDVMGAKIAAGFYGAAYEHHIEPLVIKEFDVRDGYPFWAAYAAAAHREGNGNAVLPRIYAITMPEPGTSNKGYLLMERLDRTLNEAEGIRANSEAISAYCRGYMSIFNAVSSTVSGITNNGALVPREIETTLAPVRKAGEHMLKHVARAVIHAKAAGFELDTDLHNKNAMLRGDDLVLTDPFVLGGRSKHTDEQVQAYVKQVCLRSNAYTPGFYTEFRDARREVTHF